ISQIDFNINIYIVFFSHEEEGFVGSRYFVSELIKKEELTNIIGNINIDTVGHIDEDMIRVYTADGLENAMTNLFEEYSVDKLMNSDHSSFWGKKIPSLLISQDNVIKRVTQMTNDTVTNIRVEGLQEVTDLVVKTLVDNFID
ncbi:MAG: M28 family metallopeptidase, partial [Cellulosilyticaceae bacterium]